MTYQPPLQVLPHDHLDMVTDIVFDEPEKLGEPTDLMTARAFIGKREPQWLAPQGRFEKTDAFKSLLWLTDFYSSLVKDIPEDRTRFRFAYNNATFRGSRRRRHDGRVRLSLRRIPEVTPNLADLELPQYWADMMRSPSLLRGGLVLITAPTGQGKSTTLAAMMKDRLQTYAGVGVTIEEPVELYLDGFHGSGECVQTEVDYRLPRDEQFVKGARDALQDFPALPGGGGILFISEIRDPATASQALLSAQAGFLVLSTLHADSLPHTVGRLINLASNVLTDKVARDIVASSLRLAFFQRLALLERPMGWKRGRISGECLINPSASSTIATAIRSESGVASLIDPLQKQANQIKKAQEEKWAAQQLWSELGGKDDNWS